MKNPMASFEKWSKNAQNSAEAMAAGVDGVTESPMAKAADQSDKYVRGVQDAVQSGRFANNLRAVPLEEWKSAMKNKGKANMANGVRSLSARAKRNIVQNLEYANSVKAQIASMPNSTEQDAEARMLAAMRLMKAGKRNG